MADSRDSEEGELVQSIPGGWWLGDEQVAGRTGMFFLQHVLMSEDQYSDESMHRYHINEYGRRALVEPDFDIWVEAEKDRLRYASPESIGGERNV